MMKALALLLLALTLCGCANNPIEQASRALNPGVWRAHDLEMERMRLQNELLKARLGATQVPSALEVRKAEIVSVMTKNLAAIPEYTSRFRILYSETSNALSHNDRMLVAGYALAYEIIWEQAKNQPAELSLPELSVYCEGLIQTMDELSIRGFRSAYAKLKIAIDGEIAAQAIEGKKRGL